MHSHGNPSFDYERSKLDFDGKLHSSSDKLCVDRRNVPRNDSGHLYGLADNDYKLFSHWHKYWWNKQTSWCDSYRFRSNAELYVERLSLVNCCRGIVHPDIKVQPYTDLLYLDRWNLCGNNHSHLRGKSHGNQHLHSSRGQ